MQPGQRKSKIRPLGVLALVVILGAGLAAAINAARNWNAMAAARRMKNPVPATAEAIAAGKEIYAEHCRSCHGDKGDGRGEKAAELSVVPGDFTNATAMRHWADGELFWQISRGRLPMPSFEDKLSEQERWQAVDYIRTFAGSASGSSAPGPIILLLPARPKLPSCPEPSGCRSF